MSANEQTGPLDELPLLERTGITYLRNMARRRPIEADDAIHILDEEELRNLRRVERGAVIRSGTVGAISALVSAAAVLYAESRWPDGGMSYWSLVLGVAGVAALLEILFLYWDALRSTLALTRAAGLPLFDEPDETVDVELAGSLARAALELPNSTQPTEGVDPMREAPKLKMLLVGLLYKGKIAVTNFLLKVVVRRLFGRVLVRGAEELVAIPVTAIWNATVTWLVMREARLRVVGPFAAEHLVGGLWDELAEHSPQREAAVRAVASAAVRSHDMHPNLLAMLREVKRRTEQAEASGDVDDSRDFLRELAEAPPDAQRWLIGVLTLAAISDGRLAPGERALLAEACRAAGVADHTPRAQELAKRLRGGQLITARELLPA